MSLKDENKELYEAIGQLLKATGRPAPLPGVVPYYDHEDSEIPERIRISFEGGKTAVYELRVDQPSPVIMENILIIRKWGEGYKSKPARRRRNRT